MPSSKVFAAILAALAMADASPCKPKPTGVAPSCADKVIGSPITVTDYAQCGNTCGMTVGCKSFSIKGSSCTLYKAPVSSLGYVFNEGSDASHFYDLDLCFGCGEGTTTSGTETITGSQTTGTETETSATGSETGTTTATGSETETSGTAHATGTTDTETSATGSQTETTTAPGATTETSATETLTANTDTTTAAATTTTSAGCTAYTPVANPPAADCAVRGAPNGFAAFMAQLIGIPNSNTEECARQCGMYRSSTVVDDKCLSFGLDASNTCYLYKGKSYKTYISTDTGSSADVCASKCSEVSGCKSFAYKASSSTCTFYTQTSTTEAPTTTTAAPVCTNYVPLPNAPSTCGKQGKVSCRSTQKLGQATSVTDVNACGKLCGTALTCKTFSYTPKFRSAGGYCQLYSAPLSQLSFTPCNTGVKFYDLDTCYTCSNTPTPTPPATCSKYVPAFEKCAKDTHCGTSGEICQEEKINVAGDASCLENCAKSCIDYGKDCKYFSYQPAFYNSAAKCKLYKSGKINKKSTSWVKFYEQDCFKCQQSK
ncbi:hypothetical protein ACJA88_010783 [Fusarium oxysporum]